MYCPKCGVQNNDGAKFCGSCGEKLNAPAGANAAVRAGAVNAAGGAQAAAPVVTTTATGGVTTGDGSTAAAAKKTGRLIGIAFAVVLVVAAVIVFFATGGFGLMGPKHEVKGSVNDYSWSELAAISEEIAGTASEDAAVELAKAYNLTTEEGKLDGTQAKDVELRDGTITQVQIAGFRHDDKTDGGKAGITFIFTDIIARDFMNSSYTNVGGWKDSAMRSYLASSVMAMLPSDLSSEIVSVEKMTNNVGETDDASSVTATSDKLWLYSFRELSGGYPESRYSEYPDASGYYDVCNAEGSEYKLFRDMDVDSDGSKHILVKMIDGTSCYWWERSPIPFLLDDFAGVGAGGYPGYGNDAGYENSVVPGFCI